MGVVIIDVCPKCRVDVSRRFGLIKTPLIVCRKCGYEMRVTAKAVRNNWQYNFAMAAGLFLWFVFACIILLDQKGAMDLATRLGKFKGVQSPWILAVLSFVPAFLLALPFGGIGRIFGIWKATQLLSGQPQEQIPGDYSSRLFSSGAATGDRLLQSERLMAAPRAAPPSHDHEAPPSGRGIGWLFLRVVFGVLWFVVFFVLGSFSISGVVMALEHGGQEARQQAIEAAGRAYGVPLFFGSIVLVVVLAILGWLPGFRRRKAVASAAVEAPPRAKQSDSRVILGH